MKWEPARPEKTLGWRLRRFVFLVEYQWRRLRGLPVLPLRLGRVTPEDIEWAEEAIREHDAE